MTDTTTAQRVKCPSWCATDVREDESTTERKYFHPDDRSTWHHGEPTTVPVHRPEPVGRSELIVALEMYDPDLKFADENYGPDVTVKGTDGSGMMCGLEVPVETAERLALAILELVKVARS